MSKVLVTGSHGFIGSHLVKRLEKEGYKVIKVPHDNFYENVSRILNDHPNIDYVFHFSAYGNHSTQKDPHMTIKANVGDTATLLYLLRDINYKKFIFCSTSSVYGRHSTPMNEQDLCSPETFYAYTKLMAERMVESNGKATVIRPFSVYGEGEADHRFIPTVIRSIITNTTLTLDPYATHDWIYIDDFIDGVMLSMITDYLWLNIGTGIMYENKEIVSVIEYILKKKASIAAYKSLRPNDSALWVADNRRLMYLGWKQKYPLMKGLHKTIKYYKDKYEQA